MLLTVDEMIMALRSSVNVQNSKIPVLDDNGNPVLDSNGNPVYGTIDSAYLDMTDEDIILFLKLGATRAYPEIDSLEDLPEGSDYPVVLLAKIELYLKLAVLKANKVDMTADNNNQLKQSQRFSHYMDLVEEARKEYNDWVDDGGSSVGGVTTYDLLLSKNHYSLRNYEQGKVPKVKLKIGTITSNSVEFSWSVSNVDHFGMYRIYLSESPIVDLFADGNKPEDKVKKDAIELKRTFDIRDIYHRVTGLLPNKDYYIAVFSIERNNLFGYIEKTFTTLPPFKVTSSINVTSI